MFARCLGPRPATRGHGLLGGVVTSLRSSVGRIRRACRWRVAVHCSGADRPAHSQRRPHDGSDVDATTSRTFRCPARGRWHDPYVVGVQLGDDGEAVCVGIVPAPWWILSALCPLSGGPKRECDEDAPSGSPSPTPSPSLPAEIPGRDITVRHGSGRCRLRSARRGDAGSSPSRSRREIGDSDAVESET